jgi:hypothetical protein
MSEHEKIVQSTDGQPYGHGNRLKARDAVGEHLPNERDPETGLPIGHPSFAGGASPEHGLPGSEED